MSVSGVPVPPVVRLLADPVRWLLMQELARGDQRVRELVAATGQPQNLVSYHLRQLRDGGLVSARRSSFDGRDVYYSLDVVSCSLALAAAASSLHPGLGYLPGTSPGWPAATKTVRPAAKETVRPAARGTVRRQVLFVCTGNSSRSPMAEALLRDRGEPRIRAFSAGIRPKPLHPDAAAVMRDRYRIDITDHQPVHVETVVDERFDCVISLCDKAREVCPAFSGHPARIHWSLPDPAAGEGGLAGYPAFERAAAELDTRIRFLLPVLDAGTPGQSQIRFPNLGPIQAGRSILPESSVRAMLL